MRVIIIDDDKSMLLIMKKMLSKILEIELCGLFQKPSDAFKFIRENKVDMAFVDINMPEETGLDFARRIIAESPAIDIVFLTAHKEFALEAFGVHAFDYIIKPVFQERLELTVKSAINRRSSYLLNEDKKNTTGLSVYCLGGLDIRSSTGAMVKLNSAKSAELFAYLLLNRGKSVSKWSVMEAVFRGMPPQNAEVYLNTTTYKLRKALEPYGMKGIVISANESYRVETDSIYIDFIDFENRVKFLPNIMEANLNAALKAEKIFAGELLGDRDYYWSLYEKERLSGVYESFAIKLVKCLLENKFFTQSVQILKKLSSQNELDEEINLLLMRVYAAKRDKISLIRQYEQYAKVLKRELGIEPGNMLVNYYLELLKTI